MKTKIFCDIADLRTIKFYNNKSIVDGFTFNPSLMRLADQKITKIILFENIESMQKKPISIPILKKASIWQKEITI